MFVFILRKVLRGETQAKATWEKDELTIVLFLDNNDQMTHLKQQSYSPPAQVLQLF